MQIFNSPHFSISLVCRSPMVTDIRREISNFAQWLCPRLGSLCLCVFFVSSLLCEKISKLSQNIFLDMMDLARHRQVKYVTLWLLQTPFYRSQEQHKRQKSVSCDIVYIQVIASLGLWTLLLAWRLGLVMIWTSAVHKKYRGYWQIYHISELANHFSKVFRPAWVCPVFHNTKS